MRAVPARSALFCGDLLHDLDFKVALGQQLLETGVFLLQRPQLFHVGRIQLAVALSPEIQRLLADTVLLGDLRDRRLVGDLPGFLGPPISWERLGGLMLVAVAALP